MSKNIFNALFASTALVIALPSAAFAQAAPAEDVAADEGDEIIVTTRRESENLQDVPVSVQVVSGEALQKLAINSVEEVSKLAPGLTLVNAGSNTSVTLRGVTWQPGSGTPATPVYFNDIGFDPGQTVASLFDVGQIEVQRGPQGTTRGAPSISGAVTVTTRKPDLTEFGGFVKGQYGTANLTNFQGAVNLPIIKDVLAVRFAANFEDSEANRIYSVNSALKPKLKERSYRATLLLKPTDTLTLQAMYQRRDSELRTFTQVAGPGGSAQTAFPTIRPAYSANFNGPALTTADRRSVADEPSYFPQLIDLLTVNAEWEIASHKLSYNFGRQFNRSKPTLNAVDPLNIVPGFEPRTIVANNGLPKFMVHELRISSTPNPDRPFDYDMGWYSKHSGGRGLNFNAPTYLNGAFGNPITATPSSHLAVPDPRFILNSDTNILIGQKFDSFYGNVRFHLSEKTELSGGLAIVRDRVPVNLAINTSAARTSVGALNGIIFSFPEAFRPLITSCEVAGAFARQPFVTSAVYPGTCDINIAAGPRPGQVNNDKYTKALYNFSLSHKFTDDLMVYATTGTSFRSGLPAINNPGLPASLVTPAPETATSYELGVKSKLGRGFTVNAAVFQLDYKDQLTALEGVPYFNSITSALTGSPSNTSLAFYQNLDARVRGFEVEIAARPVEGMNLGANISYSKIKSKGGLLPCNNGSVTTAARLGDLSAANPIDYCASPKGQVLNQQAPLQATINGGYEFPFSDAFGGYVRFNVNYQGTNPNFGNFRSGTALTGFTFKKTPSYAVVDLFAGVNGEGSSWDVGFYAKNVFDKQVELARVLTPNSFYSGFGAAAGYDVVRASRPREIGVSARFAFGSR